MSNKILQINYKFQVSRLDFEKATFEQAKPIANVKGLLWKIWIVNEHTREAGGIYLFNDESSVEAFLEGNIVAELKKNPVVSDIEAKIFDVMDRHSKVTRGPVG
jgi:hypothetical protein